MQGRTTFVIAHRLSTIRRADQILVVEAGQIVERGTHETLYALGGRYYDLYTRQHGLEANRFLAPGEGDTVMEPDKASRKIAPARYVPNRELRTLAGNRCRQSFVQKNDIAGSRAYITGLRSSTKSFL